MLILCGPCQSFGQFCAAACTLIITKLSGCADAAELKLQLSGQFRLSVGSRVASWEKPIHCTSKPSSHVTAACGCGHLA